MFCCVNVAGKRKITNEKQNINMYSLIIIFYPVLLSKETDSKHAFAAYLMHWFFLVDWISNILSCFLVRKKLIFLPSFTYDPKSLHISPKLAQNEVQFSEHHIFIFFFPQYSVVCWQSGHNKSKSSLCRDDT